MTTLSNEFVAGSPPRVRSRPEVDHAYHIAAGITSACAEQTRSRVSEAHS